MRKLLCLLFLVSVVQAEVLDDLESNRVSIARRLHMETVGTAQFTAANIDSQYNESRQYVSALTELYPVPYMKIDTIPLVAGQDKYALPSDFAEGGLKYCQRRHISVDGGKPINIYMPVVPLEDVVTPEEGATPSQVFAIGGGVLGVHPVPSSDFKYDSLTIWYQALPPALTLDTSSVLVVAKHREMMVLHACWEIALSTNQYAKAREFEKMYKKERSTATRTTTEQVLQ